MFRTIRSKFIFLSIAIIVAGVVIGNLLIITQLKENFHKQTSLMLETTLDIFRQGLNNEMMMNKDKNIQHILDELSKNDHIDHIRIIDPSGLIRFASTRKERDKYISDISPNHIDIKNIKKRTITVSPDNYIYSASEPILNAQQCRTCHGTKNVIAYLDVDTNLRDAENKFYEGTLTIILITAIIITLLTFSFYGLFNQLINKPLSKFINALNKVKEGALDIVLPQKRKDEFALLNSHFNNMVNKLNESKTKIEELHAEQLQRADRLVTLGELTAEMAHDINNHTAIIMSRADYLNLETTTDKMISDYSEDLNTILYQSNQVSKITGTILRHSKKYPKLNQKIDLVSTVIDCLNILNPLIVKNKIIVTKKFPDNNIIILGDQLDIEQAIMNLLTNAFDAIENDGRIDIVVDKNSDGKIVLSINDNGSGIEASVLDQIFQPFFTTKSIERGTGLGLYIVKKICDNHSAEITCKSEPGIGTTFTIQFKGNNI
ncbi:MAG: ATP-binding protein [Ignavibacteriaceae bacterium]